MLFIKTNTINLTITPTLHILLTNLSLIVLNKAVPKSLAPSIIASILALSARFLPYKSKIIN